MVMKESKPYPEHMVGYCHSRLAMIDQLLLSYDVTSVKYQFLLLLFLVCHVIMYFQTLQAD